VTKRLRAAAVLALLWAAPSRAAEVVIGVDAGRSAGKAVGLALACAPEDAARREDADLARQVRDVLRADLLFSRYFDVNDQAPPADLSADAAAEDWRRRGAVFLLSVKASPLEGQAALNVRLVDLGSGGVVLDRHYRQDARFWRSAVHRVCDDVVRQVTGRPGIAQSLLAFVGDATGSKEVYVADYDGQNARRVTADASIDLLPRWRPDRKAIAYTSYKDGNPDLYLLDLQAGKSRVLSGRQGLNLAGGFSPDGRKLAATLSREKSPNIYVLSLEDGSAQRVTEHFGADSSPTFSPDGENIAFVSDRSGNPQVHVLELATGRARRLTHLNWCDAPAWSPAGDWIAFSGRANVRDAMDIFLADITGGRVVQLTHGEGSNEDPAWSPDGRFLAFVSTRGGRRRLFVMDADGSAPHPVADHGGNVYTPAWSQ